MTGLSEARDSLVRAKRGTLDFGETLFRLPRCSLLRLPAALGLSLRSFARCARELRWLVAFLLLETDKRFSTFPACDSLATQKRKLRPPGEKSCNCTEGWEGINCNGPLD
jgi:hypothetical protein